jgi:hypothetical protein
MLVFGGPFLINAILHSILPNQTPLIQMVFTEIVPQETRTLHGEGLNSGGLEKTGDAIIDIDLDTCSKTPTAVNTASTR